MLARKMYAPQSCRNRSIHSFLQVGVSHLGRGLHKETKAEGRGGNK